MLKKFAALAAGVAAMGFAGSAMAQATSSSDVNVNINVLATVSLWGNDASLTLDGSNPPDNSDAVASQLFYINNVDANVSASVAGLPVADSGAGEGIQFHIFPDTGDPGVALAAINANQYGPAGAATFNYANQATPQTVIPSTGVNTTIFTRDIVYAAGLPGDSPPPGSWTAVITYTITEI
jgi:hypothetical protein